MQPENKAPRAQLEAERGGTGRVLAGAAPTGLQLDSLPRNCLLPQESVSTPSPGDLHSWEGAEELLLLQTMPGAGVCPPIGQRPP